MTAVVRGLAVGRVTAHAALEPPVRKPCPQDAIAAGSGRARSTARSATYGCRRVRGDSASL